MRQIWRRILPSSASALERVNATEKDHQKTTETPQLSARCLDRIGSVESASYSNVGPYVGVVDVLSKRGYLCVAGESGGDAIAKSKTERKLKARTHGHRRAGD